VKLSPRISGGAFRWLRIALAMASLVVLVVKIGHSKPLERLAAATPWCIALAVVVVIADGLTRAWNWTQLMRAMHIAPRVRYTTVMAIHWGGAFLGQVLPSTMGTDALRVMMATRKIGGHASAHWAAVAMLNMISLVTGCGAALLCAFWLSLTHHRETVRPALVALFFAAISVAGLGYWMLRTQRGLILRCLRLMRGRWRQLRRGLRRFMHRVLVFERYDVNAAPVFGIALATLLTRATVYALVGMAVGVVLPFPAWIALVPAYMLSGLIPYSVSGYGGDQAAIVYILTGFGANPGAALAFALIVPLMSLAYNMLGGFSVLFGRLETRTGQPADRDAVSGSPNV
jgi:uncharacterized protein (TIRG00374 family)